jgi:hypothetical protein
MLPLVFLFVYFSLPLAAKSTEENSTLPGTIFSVAAEIEKVFQKEINKYSEVRRKGTSNCYRYSL